MFHLNVFIYLFNIIIFVSFSYDQLATDSKADFQPLTQNKFDTTDQANNCFLSTLFIINSKNKIKIHILPSAFKMNQSSLNFSICQHQVSHQPLASSPAQVNPVRSLFHDLGYHFIFIAQYCNNGASICARKPRFPHYELTVSLINKKYLTIKLSLLLICNIMHQMLNITTLFGFIILFMIFKRFVA